MASGLHKGWRHLVHVLCVRVDAQSGLIPSQWQPSLSELARDTGWDRRTVQRYLDGLEGAGWITRQRPTRHAARTTHARVQYAVHIGQRAKGTESPGPRGTRPSELGASTPKARGVAPLRSSRQNESATDLDSIIKAIQDKTGTTVTRDWAGRVADQVTEGRPVRNLGAYVAAAVAAAPADRFLPHSGPPTVAQRLAELASLTGKEIPA